MIPPLDAAYIAREGGTAMGASGGGSAGGASGAGAALKAAGALMRVFGTLDSAFAESSTLTKKARALRREGKEAKRLSDYRTRLIRYAGAEVLGGIEAETAKSGLAMVGTPLASLVDTARQVELSAQLENRAGTMEQRRYNTAAHAAKKEAREAKHAGVLGAIGGLF